MKKIITLCMLILFVGSTKAQLFKRLKDKANQAINKATDKVVDKATKVPEKVVEHPIEKVQQKIENNIDNTQNKANGKTDNAIDKTDNIKIKKKKNNAKPKLIVTDSLQVQPLKTDSSNH